ncbi:MAG: GNAT family N-acetyltransferase [Verrucomicrobiota bacterium]
MSELRVRLVKDDERSALLELYEHLHEEDIALPEEAALANAWKEFTEERSLFCFVGEFDGLLASSCVLSVVPNLTRACRPYGLIENVVSRRQFRRRGFAKAVLERALDFAKEKGCYKVMLLSGRREEGVRRFYESCGFDPDSKQAFVQKLF